MSNFKSAEYIWRYVLSYVYEYVHKITVVFDVSVKEF